MKNFRTFWKVINKRFKKNFLILLFLMLLGAVFETLGVTLIIPVILAIVSDEIVIPLVLNNLFPFLSSSSNETLLTYSILVFICFFFIKSIFLFYLVFFQSNFVYSLQQNISTRLYKAYIDQPYSFHLRKNSGDIISNTITESMQFALGYASPLTMILTDIFIVSGIFMLLVIIEPIGAFSVSFIFITGSLLLYSFSKRRSELWGQKRQDHEAKRIRTAQQGIGGIKDIKVYGLEKFFSEEYSKNTLISLNSGRKQTILQGLPKIYFEMLTVLSLSGLIFFFVLLSSSSTELVTILGIYAMAAFKLLPSISRLTSNFQALKFGVPVIKIIENELNLESKQKYKIGKEKIIFKKDIILKSIFYSYKGSKYEAIKNINISIQEGKSIGFVGESGAGKSTLIDLILGLLIPSKGSILIDGKKLDINNLKSWQQNIGYVSQSAYLLDDSLKKNIAFGLPEDEIDEMKIKKAVSLSQLNDLVSSLPNGLESFIGESGVRISGGQRQRISIARALYNDPSILILDEATSSLDHETEKEVMNAVDNLKGNKTIIIIAHRHSTVKNCDFLYRLEKGEIISQGKPEELID
tara:strand:+ start:2009 stop:3751 length:1743 start_codon:yes stop_codon:yes gene_type:complete